jgi:hypothetical protein
MESKRGRTAVCVVRLEQQGRNVLIVVRTSPVTGISPGRRLPFVDPDKAVAAVRDFVETFIRGASS